MRKLLYVLFTLVLLVGFSACRGERSAAATGPAASGLPTIRIAVAAPLSGNLANMGEQFRQGAQTRANEINAAGGVNGRMIELVLFDDRNDPAEAANISQLVVADESILAVIGHFSSSCIFASTPILDAAPVAMITPSASHVDLTRGNNVIFKMWSGIDIYTPMVADLAITDHGLRNIAVISAQTDWGLSVRDTFIERAQQLGARIVANQIFNEGDRDFRTQLTNIRASGADALAVFAFYGDGIVIVPQIRQMGITLPLYTTGTFYEEEFVQIAGPEGEGMWGVNEFVSDDPRESVVSFLEVFGRTFPGVIPGSYHGNAYDAMGAIIHAFQNSDGSREGILDGLHNLVGFNGITGELSFANQEIVKPQVYIQLVDGRWRYRGMAPLRHLQ